MQCLHLPKNLLGVNSSAVTGKVCFFSWPLLSGKAGIELWWIEGVEEFDFCCYNFPQDSVSCASDWSQTPSVALNFLFESVIPLLLLPESGITEVHHQLRGSGNGARALWLLSCHSPSWLLSLLLDFLFLKQTSVVSNKNKSFKQYISFNGMHIHTLHHLSICSVIFNVLNVVLYSYTSCTVSEF